MFKGGPEEIQKPRRGFKKSLHMLALDKLWLADDESKLQYILIVIIAPSLLVSC